MIALRLIRVFHAWCGATLALLVMLISFTGVLLVWKQDYIKMTTPEANDTYVPDPASLAAIANAVEERYDNNEILLIEFPTSDFALTKVTLDGTRYAYLDIQGEVVDEWFENERPEEWLYDLHHRLLLGNVGLTITGISALVLIVLVIAGTILFWPLRRSFSQGFWPNSVSRPRLLVSHRNIGIIAALPFLLTLMTAAVLAFPQQSVRLLLEPFRGEEYSQDFSEKLDDISGPENGDWLSVIQRAQTSFPNSAIRTAQLPTDYDPYRTVGLQQPGELHPQGLSKIYIDSSGGWMDIRIDSTNQNLSERIYSTAYPLHTGRFNNLAYKIYLTLSGLLIFGLSALGLICFLKKNRK